MLLLSRRELLALSLLFLVSLPAVTSRLYSSDEVQYFSYLRSLYFDRDVSFENEYRYFYDRNIAQSAGFHETFLERTTAANRRVNYATMGCAILWLPFYTAADLVVRGTGIAEADGFSKPYVRAVAYGSAFYGFLAVLLSIRAVRYSVFGTRYSVFGTRYSVVGTRYSVVGTRYSVLEVSRAEHRTPDPEYRTPRTEHRVPNPGSVAFDATFWAGVAVWLGTPLLFYMYIAPPFSHAVSAFGVALFVNVWLHVRQTWSPGGVFVLGIVAALLAMIREQDVFVALGPALDFALALRTLNSRVILAALAGIAGFVVGYTPQLLAYDALNGYPGPASHVTRKMFWYAPHGWDVLFSPNHGFFFWTPLALLAIAGLVLLAVRTSGDLRRIGFTALIMAGSQVYVAGSVASWTVAGAFGQRRFVCLTAVLVMGLAAFFGGFAKNAPEGAHYRKDAPNGAHYVRVGVAALCVWWNIALMFQFATGLMDRQRMEPGRNAYHAFVTVPLEAPSLIARYLTNRESFYHPPPRLP